MAINVTWGNCAGDDRWCGFIALDLNHVTFNDLRGVYIIWSGQTVVRLGSGIIKNRIADHRNDPAITRYPDLKVTWAQVNANQMEGVEKYLADLLNPVVGDRFPDRTPVEVNLPW